MYKGIKSKILPEDTENMYYVYINSIWKDFEEKMVAVINEKFAVTSYEKLNNSSHRGIWLTNVPFCSFYLSQEILTLKTSKLSIGIQSFLHNIYQKYDKISVISTFKQRMNNLIFSCICAHLMWILIVNDIYWSSVIHL